MQGLRIVNKSGAQLTPEEITIAHRVANTRRNADISTSIFTDDETGVTVEYFPYKNLAITQAGNKSIYFGWTNSVAMRCKCRSLSLYQTNENVTDIAYKSAAIISDGTELVSIPLSEELNYELDGGLGTVTYHDGVFLENFYYVSSLYYNSWSGSKIIPYGRKETYPGFKQKFIKNGELTITIPDDVCFYPADVNPYPGVGTYNPYFDITSSYSYPVTTKNVTIYPRYSPEIHINGTITILGDSSEVYSNWFVNLQDSESGSGASSTRNPTDGIIKPLYGIRWQIFNGVYSADGIWSGTFTALTPSYFDVLLADLTIDDATDIYADAVAHELHWYDSQREARYRENVRRKKCSDGQMAYLRNGFLSPEFESFIKNTHPVSALISRDIPMQVVKRSYTVVSEVSDEVHTITTYQANVKLKYTVNINGDDVDIEKEFIGSLTEKTTTHSHPILSPYFSSQITYTNFPLLTEALNGEAYPSSDYANFEFESILFNYYINNSIIHDDNLTAEASPLLVIANGTLSNSEWISDSEFKSEINSIFDLPYYDINFPLFTPAISPLSANVTFEHPQFIYDYIAASKPIEKTVDIDGNKVPVTPSTDWLSSRLEHNEVITVVPFNMVQDIKIFYVTAEGSPTSVIELEVDGAVVETIVGNKTDDGNGGFIYNRYFDMSGSGRWGELKTTGSTKTETIISSPEYQNVLANIAKGDVFNLSIFGNCGMYPYDKTPGNIDHFIVYGYARFKFDYYRSAFTFIDWTEFTEDGKLKIFADDLIELDNEDNPTSIAIKRGSDTTFHKLAPRVGSYPSALSGENCVCIGNKVMFTDTKATAKQQSINMKDHPLDNVDTTLYRVVSDIING